MELRLKTKKDCARWSLLGLILTLLGLLILFTNPVEHLVKNMTKMKEGSMAHEMWKKLPVEILLDIYLYNITNAERFISGKDSKLALQEIGPYVFKESRGNHNITFNEDGTMTYVPNVVVTLVPELSAGDPKVDRVVCINMPFMGIFSNNANASAWKQLGLNMFAQTINSESVLNLSVDELMWGYEDKLVRLASGYYPDWISFNKFGIIDRMYADKSSVVTIDLNESPDKLYKIKNWNGISGLTEWGYTNENSSLPCNTLTNSYEGLMFPSNLAEGSSISVYKKIFCRTLRLYHTKSMVMDSGLLGYEFELPPSALSCANPENVCYCSENGPCLPNGLTDVSPCYYGLPVAISFPHFLGGNSSLLEKFTGLEPDVTKHSSKLIIQPTKKLKMHFSLNRRLLSSPFVSAMPQLCPEFSVHNFNIGMPMEVTSKIQLNLVLNNMNYNAKLKPFSKMTVPILWMDARVDGLPKDLELKILIVFKYLPIAQRITYWMLICVGLAMFLYKSILYIVVSIKASQTKQQPSLRYIPVSLKDNDFKKEIDIKAYE